MEQLDYNLLFHWFVGLGVDDPMWDVTVFTKNRDRLLAGAIAAKFLRAVLAQPKVKALLSDEHLSCRRLRLSVDGTLIQAWASLKSSWAAGSVMLTCFIRVPGTSFSLSASHCRRLSSVQTIPDDFSASE